jgi:hypothetical protein
MRKRFFVLMGLAALTFIFISMPSQAQDRPIQVSLVTPIQIFPEDNSITGFRLNLIYGRNISITGLDLGLVNHTTTGTSKGVQFGFVGLVDVDYVGWQDNSVNITKGKFKGLQWGIVNYAEFANGLQLGLVNYVESMKGIQIGLINIIRQEGMLPFFPIFNYSF